MNELLQALRLSHLEAELPALYEQARLHSLTYEAFLRRVLPPGNRRSQAGSPAQSPQSGALTGA